MEPIRGTGITPSAPTKRWFPFRGNPIVAARNARLRRLKRKGLTPPPGKAAARALCAEVATTLKPQP